MPKHVPVFVIGLAAMLLISAAYASQPLKSEINMSNSWNNTHFMSNELSEVPFSFVYNGQPSNELLSRWKMHKLSKKLDKTRTQTTSIWTDPQSNLQVKCVSVKYTDYPTIEWTVYFKNTGTEDTSILSNILSLDTKFTRSSENEFVLHHFIGTPCTPADYQPLKTILKSNSTEHISAAGGRPSNTDLPYFNLEWDNGGAIIAIGWPGQWSSNFVRDNNCGITIEAGQELTHFKLHSGEEVRTPMSVIQFYKGKWSDAQNVWRSWMLAHNVPRINGKLPPIQMSACSSHQYGEMINANTQNQKMFIDRYVDNKLPLDYWWMDAGWYINNGHWSNTGTWEVDQKRFPGGLKSISDYAHLKGIKTIVWFEPERVTPGTWLYSKSDWLLTNPDDKNGQKLLNLGNDEARKWLTDHIDNIIKNQKIDFYRQDFNIDPLVFWRASDSEDRQGITEIRYVEGYLAYWDELRHRHPNMLIDSCASGGRRNDIETLRRAVPLLRSDYLMEPISQQCHTYGSAFWYPYCGTATHDLDTYHFRSQMCPAFNACFDMRSANIDFESTRKMLLQWKNELGPNYFGDYYPLTDYSLENNVWMAFQWNRPDVGKGAIQLFRREESPQASCNLKLNGLEENAKYNITDLDRGSLGQYSGKDLMDKGFNFKLENKPDSAIIIYSKLK